MVKMEYTEPIIWLGVLERMGERINGTTHDKVAIKRTKKPMIRKKRTH
jgi:hypothetical protein